MKKELLKIVTDFINKHWDEIDLKSCDIQITKNQALKKIKKEQYYLEWFFLEVMYWGCTFHKDYLTQYKVEHPDSNDFIVYKLNKKFVRWNHDKHELVEVIPKKKIIYVYEDIND